MADVPSNPVSMEDLRPKYLEEIVGQADVVARLRRLVEGVRAGRIVPPNLLLHGPPGVGKTTAARAFAREVLGEHFDNSYFQLRTSDDRGIGVVQEGIVPLSRKPPSRGAPFRIFFFDEADTLVPEVQSALRSALEGGHGTSLFILACNDLDRISLPMQSRCTALEFLPIASTDMRRLIVEAAAKIPLTIDEATLESMIGRTRGIPREAVKLLIEEYGRVPRSGVDEDLPRNSAGAL